MVGAQHFVFDIRIAYGRGELFRNEKVVDAPADVLLPRPRLVRPPGVTPLFIAVDEAKCLYLALCRKPVQEFPLFRQEARAFLVLFGPSEVY